MLSRYGEGANQCTASDKDRRPVPREQRDADIPVRLLCNARGECQQDHGSYGGATPCARSP